MLLGMIGKDMAYRSSWENGLELCIFLTLCLRNVVSPGISWYDLVGKDGRNAPNSEFLRYKKSYEKWLDSMVYGRYNYS